MVTAHEQCVDGRPFVGGDGVFQSASFLPRILDCHSISVVEELSAEL